MEAGQLVIWSRGWVSIDQLHVFVVERSSRICAATSSTCPSVCTANLKVNMVLNVHRNHKAYQGQGRRVVWRWGKREIIYLSLHCHHQNDFCIKMGSNESHFSFINCEGQSHKTMSTNCNLSEEKGELKQNPNQLLLGQTSSQSKFDNNNR